MCTMKALVACTTLLFCVRSSESCTGRCIVDGPRSRSAQAKWLENLKDDRTKTLARIQYKGGVFDLVEWTQSAWIQPQMHPYDRFFYDPVTHNYTVQKFLQDLKNRYGGVDAILMWPTYTNMGVDDRNQFDYFRSMPGGLDGVKRVTDELKANGVRVLWPYNPWDKGTRRETSDDEHMLVKLLKETHGDGFNGDGMDFVPKSFWDVAKESDYPLAFEPESGGTDEELNWATMGWGYWTYPIIPVVDRFKFLTGGKFMTNVCDRWSFDKTDQLQLAWFNGDGYESWENVWGTWNGITPYDGEAIRRVATMLRYLGKEGFLHSPAWEPHTLDVWQEDIFASKWPLTAKHATVWTIVNRGKINLTVGLHVQGGNKYYYDCYHGVELKVGQGPPVPTPPSPPKGYNAIHNGKSFNGHGGLEIDTDPMPGRYDIATCTARCDALPTCSCVTFKPSTGHCWRRAQCQPAQFQNVVGFDTYLKAQGYSFYPGRNCYNGSGAIDIDVDGVAVSDASDCLARCDSDKNCGCVAMSADQKKCWKRKDCERENWDDDAAYDIYFNEGREAPPVLPSQGPNVTFSLEAQGYGCVLETDNPADDHVSAFLDRMNNLTQRSLHSFSSEWKYELQKMITIPTTQLVNVAPPGMVLIPKNKFNFINQGVEIEGDDGHGVDVQYPWEEHPQREHSHVLELGPFYIDKYPVTVASYSRYLKASGFRPSDPYNWLKNWNGSVSPPAAILDMPVTYVSLSEARAYCSWAGARLPHSYEWQYAAQGTDGRKYPWGNSDDQSRYPKEQNGTKFMGSEPVRAHAPAGDSPFGVSDLVGNVWQYTDEFHDHHTRFAILMGGSNYRPDGGPTGRQYYFPQAKPLNTHGKYFLMDNRYERAGTIGFRCVVDAPDQARTYATGGLEAFWHRFTGLLPTTYSINLTFI